MSEAAQRLAWKSYDGNEAAMVEISFGLDRMRVARPTVEAWRALETVLEAHDYVVSAGDSHGYFPRNVEGSDARSLHAFGLAIDINASTNPVRKTPNGRKVRFSDKATQRERARDVKQNIADTDMTREMIADVRAIRTLGSKTVFGWGGDWNSKKDAMHFHIDVSPTEMGFGIDWSSVSGHQDFVNGDHDAGVSSSDEDEEQDHVHSHDDDMSAFPLFEETQMAEMSSVQRFRPLLDFIAECEGTANQPGGGYDTSLGYGIFTGGEQPLTSMTLDEIDSLQRRMLRHPKNRFNSSALGRYQIVGKTLRGLRQKLGLSGSQIFSADLQDRLGVVLIQGRGRNARALGLEWASLQNKPSAKILAKYDERGGPVTVITPDDRPMPYSADILVELLRRLLHKDVPGPGNGYAVLKQGDRGPQVKALQQALHERQYEVGKIDGVFGTLTTAAVSAFQIDYNVSANAIGQVDDTTWAALNDAPSRPLSKERRNTTADDLRRSGSVIVANADRTRFIGWASSILGTLGLGNSAYNNLGTSTNLGTGARAASQTASTVTADAAMSAEAFARLIKDVPAAILQQFFPVNPQQMNAAIAKAHDIAIAAAQKAGAAVVPSPSASGLVETLLPTVINSVLPGFGGSLAVLGLGIATHLFGSRIIERRVQNQRDGSNIGPGSN